MSVSVLPNWRIWMLKPNATTDECLFLSLGLNPEILWLQESAPFNDSLDYWNQPAPRNSGGGAGLSGRPKLISLQSTEDFIIERLAKCKWAQAFPELKYEERMLKWEELETRASIVSNQKLQIDRLRSADGKLAGLTKAELTFYFFHKELDFEMPREVMNKVEATLQVLGKEAMKHEKRPEPDLNMELDPKRKNSYLKIIAGLVRTCYADEVDLTAQRMNIKVVLEDLEKHGLGMDKDTLSGILKEAGALFPPQVKQ